MTLQSRLADLVAAVGADIKDIRTKIQPISVTQDSWHSVGSAGEPAFQNGWTAAETARFYKDPSGVVRLTGRIQSGPAGVTAFTLPPGYRPGVVRRLAASSNGVAGTVDVGADGTVAPIVFSGWIDLSSVSFSTEQTTFPAGKSIIPVVSALPGGTDGDEVYYQSAAMALIGVMWRLRYRAASTSAYKWEVVGNSSLIDYVAADEVTNSLGYAALATAGPTITVPLAGDYIVAHGMIGYGLTPGDSSSMSYDIGATAAVDADNVKTQQAQNTQVVSLSRDKPKTIAAAATALTAKYKAGVASGTCHFAERWMRVTPIRVG